MRLTTSSDWGSRPTGPKSSLQIARGTKRHRISQTIVAPQPGEVFMEHTKRRDGIKLYIRNPQLARGLAARKMNPSHEKYSTRCDDETKWPWQASNIAGTTNSLEMVPVNQR